MKVYIVQCNNNTNMTSPVLYLYLITNRKEGVQTSTKIGCVSDIEDRVQRYNSTIPIPGSERRTRQAAGYWKPLLVIVVPAASKLSGRALAIAWAGGSRRIHCRFQYGIEQIARHYGLEYFIDTDELQADERIVKELPDLVKELVDSAVHNNRDYISKVANLVMSPTYRPLTTKHSNGLSFAKADKPRIRYIRKRAQKNENAADAAANSNLPKRQRVTTKELDSIMKKALAGTINYNEKNKTF